MQNSPNTTTTNPGVSGSNIISALFKDSAQGERALADLKSAGFARAEVSGVGLQAGNGAGAAAPPRQQPTGAAAAGGAATDMKFFSEHDSSPSSFVGELTRLGFSKSDAHDLVEGVTKGGAMVTVDAGANSSKAMDILKGYKGDVRSAGAGIAAAGTAATAGYGAKDDTQNDREMQLRAERLQVSKERIGHGEARIRKEVVSENQSVDVPVSHEELVIERHAAGADRAATGPIGKGEEIRVPLSEERVNVGKSTVVTEEVGIGKRNVAGVERVDDTVRHEELVVDEDDAPDSYDQSATRKN